jgi:hypothetical protein
MKVLLTGNLFHSYELEIVSAFQEINCHVDFAFNNIHGPFHELKDIVKRYKYGILPHRFNINFFLKNNIQSYNKNILNLLEKNKYDFILVIGGKTFDSNLFKSYSTPKILWSLDSLTNLNINEKLGDFEFIFSFEPSDLKVYKYLPNISYLGVGFNPAKFYPLNDKKIYNFSFIGSMYENREFMLNKLFNEFNNSVIIGAFKKSKFPILRKNNLKINVPLKDINKYFNQSYINLNIHHPQSRAWFKSKNL